MRSAYRLIILATVCLVAVLAIGVPGIAVPPTKSSQSSAPPAPPAPAPAQPTAATPPAPVEPPVSIAGRAEGHEILAVGDTKGLNSLLSVSWDGRRAASARYTDDTNGDGVVDSRDYPTVSFFDALTRKSTKLFTPSERVISVQWADPDRVLVLRSRPKTPSRDERGDLALRVLPTGKETPLASDVAWVTISPNGQHAFIGVAPGDTSGDGNIDRSDVLSVSLLDLRPAQPAPVRVLSGFAVLSCSPGVDGSFHYIARREDTNRDGRLNQQDAWRAYFYDASAWQSQPLSSNMKGSIIFAEPAPQGGVIALIERDKAATGEGIEDALYFRRADGSLAGAGTLGSGREVLRVQWSQNGQRCAVSYRQTGQLGIHPVGVMIYNIDARLVRHYEAVPLSGVSYPSFLWSPGGRGYILERRTEETDDPHPTGRSEFLSATDAEEALPVYQFSEPTVLAGWTGAGILFTRFPEGGKAASLGLFVRYRFSGTLSVYHPLARDAAGLKITIRPSNITPRGLYFRVLAVNESEKEAPFDPSKLTLSAGGAVLPVLTESDLMADLSARSTIDTLMQAYTLQPKASYGGYIAFGLPADPFAQMKLVVSDAAGAPLAEYAVECQVNLEIY